MKEIWENRSLETLDGEIWKDVIDFEGIYQISNFCRIKSLSRLWKPTSKGKTKTPELILKWTVNHDGYLVVDLRNNGKRKGGFSHRMVANAFIPNPDNLPEINHKNGIKTDNRIENLEWCTNLENIQHASVNGLRKDNKGIIHYRSMPLMAIDEKRCSVISFCSVSSAIKLLGIGRTSMYRYLQGIRHHKSLKFQFI